jgi:hypothetical protein
VLSKSQKWGGESSRGWIFLKSKLGFRSRAAAAKQTTSKHSTVDRFVGSKTQASKSGGSIIMSSWTNNIKRALGIRNAGFRRGGSNFFNYASIAVAAGVGVVSGHYIFDEPLKEYWREENERQQRQQEQQEGGERQPTQQQETKSEQ